MSDDNTQTEIALLQNEISHLRDEVKILSKDFKSHDDMERENRDMLIRLNGIKKQFEAHVITDRWLFGVLITLIGFSVWKGY